MTTNTIAYMRSYYSKKHNAVVASLGDHCLICNTQEHLEIHHICGYKNGNGKGRGQTTRLTDWLLNMDKLVLLCTTHHKEYENMYKHNVNRETLLDYILYKFIQNTEWN